VSIRSLGLFQREDTLECVSHTQAHTPKKAHALLGICTPSLAKRWKHLAKSWKLALKLGVGLSLGQCAPLSLPLHPPHTPTFHSHSNLKAYAPSLTWSSSWLGFLTFVKDPRGVSLPLLAINETSPSLILHHSSEYCYATNFLPSLSLSLIVTLLHFICS
jgi:hypothetical protein